MTEPNEGNEHKEKRVKTIENQTHQGLDVGGLRQGRSEKETLQWHLLVFICFLIYFLISSVYSKIYPQSKWSILEGSIGNFLVVQWLGLCTSSAGGLGLLPGWGTNIL